MDAYTEGGTKNDEKRQKPKLGTNEAFIFGVSNDYGFFIVVGLYSRWVLIDEVEKITLKRRKLRGFEFHYIPISLRTTSKEFLKKLPSYDSPCTFPISAW